MACSNCSCKSNPEKDIEDIVPFIPDSTLKIVNKKIDDLTNEVSSINYFLKNMFPKELTGSCGYWKKQKEISDSSKFNRHVAILDLRAQGYTVIEPSIKTGEYE
jgi:hypothetical protein